MKRDEAIEAVRAVRRKISAEHGHDTRRLVKHYQDMEKRYAHRMLREPVSVPTDTEHGAAEKS